MSEEINDEAVEAALRAFYGEGAPHFGEYERDDMRAALASFLSNLTVKKPKNLTHITDISWAKAVSAFPRSVVEETPNIIEWAAEAIQSYEADAISASQARLSEAVKVLEEAITLLDEAADKLEAEGMWGTSERDMANRTRQFLATLGEEK